MLVCYGASFTLTSYPRQKVCTVLNINEYVFWTSLQIRKLRYKNTDSVAQHRKRRFKRRRKDDGTVLNVSKNQKYFANLTNHGVGDTCELKKRCLGPDSIYDEILRDYEYLRMLKQFGLSTERCLQGHIVYWYPIVCIKCVTNTVPH